jgi:hypothetical protein
MSWQSEDSGPHILQTCISVEEVHPYPHVLKPEDWRLTTSFRYQGHLGSLPISEDDSNWSLGERVQ